MASGYFKNNKFLIRYSRGFSENKLQKNKPFKRIKEGNSNLE